MSIKKDLKHSKMFSALLIFLITKFFFSFSIVENKNLNNISSNEKFYSSNSPLENFLEAISSNISQSFCIKRVVGKPEKYKSYACPNDMKLIQESEDVVKCVKNCPKDMILGPHYCESKCKDGFKKVYDNCIKETEQSENYKRKFYPIIKNDPICINGYYLNNYCHSCMGHTDFSGDTCLSPCEKGAILEPFCAFEDYSNKRLSTINTFWAKFIRDFFSDLFLLFKNGPLNRPIYGNAKNLKEISEIILNNVDNKIIKTDSGRIMIFIRDKFGVNLNDHKIFLRNIFQKMFQRYAVKDINNSQDILAVVDELINFKGDYTSDYLDKKTYENKFLPFTVSNFLNHIC
jgi:hypothetical protein